MKLTISFSLLLIFSCASSQKVPKYLFSYPILAQYLLAVTEQHINKPECLEEDSVYAFLKSIQPKIYEFDQYVQSLAHYERNDIILNCDTYCTCNWLHESLLDFPEEKVYDHQKCLELTMENICNSKEYTNFTKLKSVD